MTPSARVSAAIEILDAVLDGQAAEQALIRWARGARYAGSKDRAAVRDHVFQALRCLDSYASLGGAKTGRGIMIGALRANGDDPVVYFDGQGFGPKALSEQELSVGETPTKESIRYDFPDWLLAKLKISLGSNAISQVKALRGRAPITLRVNLRSSTVSQAIELLSQDGVHSEPTDISDSALIVTQGERRIKSSQAYQDGSVELQDGSSQAAMEALPVQTGSRILDYCAGGGGKILALAARSEAKYYAHDADSGRMKDLPVRARRGGAQIELLKPGEEKQMAPYDLVLCDVPCSGSGTWRRTPEAKWRFSSDKLDELRTTQSGILDTAANLVSAGGVLAYATCSILAEENEIQVKRFLERRANWNCVSQLRWPISDEGDGFFLAQFKKTDSI